MRTFGMSAPIKVVAEHFGFTMEKVVAAAKEATARGAWGSMEESTQCN
jgi:transketolase